jgi:uncharacterized repeat protein (TIGR02543 family)
MDNTENAADVDNGLEPANNKITSLQAVINDSKDGETINLSQYTDITDYNATVNKSLTISGSSTNLNNAMLTVGGDNNNVSISGITNASVTADKSLGNGSLKISGSSLSGLNIQGGGWNSIYLEHGTSVTGQTILNKSVSDNNDEFVRLVLDSSVTVQDLVVKQSAILAAESIITADNIKNVTFSIDESSDAVAFAVGANISFGKDNSLVCVTFIDSDESADLMKMFVRKSDKSSIITPKFFVAAFEHLVRPLDGDTKTAMLMQFEDVIGVSLIGDVELYVEGLDTDNSESSSASDGSSSSDSSSSDSSSSSSDSSLSDSSSSSDDSSSGSESGEHLTCVIRYTGDMTVDVTVDYGEPFTVCDWDLVYTAAPAGKEFLGWNTTGDKNGVTYSVGQEVTNTAAPDSVTVLYPVWDYIKYSIGYYDDGGTDISDEFSLMSFTINDDVSLKPAQKTGYIFAGWYRNSTDTESISGWSAGDVTADIDLTAKWTPITYTVRYHIGAGSETDETADQLFIYDTEQSLAPNRFEVDNWVFMGWSKELQSALGDEVTVDYEDCGYIDESLAEDQDAIVDLYAVWNRAWIVYADLSYSKEYTYNLTNLPIGVALECETGKPAKIIATQDVTNTLGQPTSYQWAITTTQTNLNTTEYDGYANTQSILNTSSTFGINYPLFGSLSALNMYSSNVKLYIPAKNELLTLYDNLAKVNASLSALRGTLISEQTYWSSTQTDDTSKAYAVEMATGQTAETTLTEKKTVRPFALITQ